MWNDTMKLVRIIESTNEVGDLVKTRSEREVFVDVKSIGQSEFYQAQATGLKPEFKFILADFFDYENEKIVNYDGKDYRIVRIFRSGNRLEMVCEGDVNANT